MDRYEGFREFFAARRSALSRAAFLLTGSTQAAEELLQEALVRTVARWPKVTADGNSPEAYVRQVMLNEIRSRWRRRRVGVEHPTDLPPELAQSSDLANEAADRHVLAVALRQLAPRQRAVLFLRFYEDLSEAESARLLGCSVGTVKSQTHDAVKRLRELAPELRFRSTEVAR